MGLIDHGHVFNEIILIYHVLVWLGDDEDVFDAMEVGDDSLHHLLDEGVIKVYG